MAVENERSSTFSEFLIKQASLSLQVLGTSTSLGRESATVTRGKLCTTYEY